MRPTSTRQSSFAGRAFEDGNNITLKGVSDVRITGRLEFRTTVPFMERQYFKAWNSNYFDLPHLPPQRKQRRCDNSKAPDQTTYAKRNDDSIHHRTHAKFSQLRERGSIQYITNRMEGRVLWIFDKPHATGTEYIPAGCKKNGKLVHKHGACGSNR